MRPHRQQPTRLPRPWDSPGKNTGVGCHLLLQCMKVKSESEVTQSCLTQWSRGLQPTGLLHPWDFPGKSTGVGCHCLLWEHCLAHNKYPRTASCSQSHWKTEATYKNQNSPPALGHSEIQEGPGPAREGRRTVPSRLAGTDSRQFLVELLMHGCTEKVSSQVGRTWVLAWDPNPPWQWVEHRLPYSKLQMSTNQQSTC